MDCINPIFLPKLGHEVGCGACNYCLTSSSLDWCYRLQWEHKKSSSAKFITLTYSDEYLPINYESGEGTLDKADLQKFFKRFRKINDTYSEKNRKPIRYFATGEYGTKLQRPHYHIILFNAKREAINRLHQAWPLGQIDIGRVTPASIGYVASHSFFRQRHYGPLVRPFATMSRKPGIGYDYVKSNSGWHRDPQGNEHRFYVTDNGHRRKLPRYYKEKLFDGEERRVYNVKLQQAREDAYCKAIEAIKLAYKHSDPYLTYEHMAHQGNEAIGRRKKKNRKL
ncbi:MAG: replication initiator protein [Microviridae sp.]|nr:MAG: replication initiator protein [Microviridae sp.]